MARAFWSGHLSFGLVEIPVRLHKASESDDIDLTMLDKDDLSPIGYQRISKKTGKEVPWKRIVRGYELSSGKVVVLTPQDFERANVEATRTIDIVEFVEKDEIEPLYYESPYYVEPANRASKSYALLRESLSQSNKVGIAKVVLHTRQHLAALLVSGPLLVLDLLRFAHEIRKPEGLKIPAVKSSTAKVSAAEVRMAEKLIEGMTRPWKPSEFRDEYRDDLLALIRKKARTRSTHAIEVPEEVPRPKKSAEVVDLMPLLKESLAARGRKSAKKSAGSRTRRASTKTAKTRRAKSAS